MFSDPFFFSCLSDGCHPVFNLHAGGLPAILAGGHLRFTLPRLERLITCRRLPGSRAFSSHCGARESKLELCACSQEDIK
jgi:hypothetical protein